MDGMTRFRKHQDVAAVEHDEAGKPLEGGEVRHGCVTEVRLFFVTARFDDGETRLFRLDSRDRGWNEAGRWRLAPLCRCELPILGEPVTAEDGSEFCGDDCRDDEAQARYEQRYPSGVAT